MNRLLIVIAVLSAVLLISCAATEDAGEATDESVIEAARSWVMAAASAQGVEALGLTCVDLRQAVQTENLVGTSISDLFRLRLDSIFEADFSGLRYQVVERAGGMAVLQVNGNARLAAYGSEIAVELNEKWTMREEDGRWKWCGSGR